MTKRDNQRARLYAADDVLEPFAKPLASHGEVKKFVTKVWKSKRLRKDYPRAFRYLKPKVKDGKGHRHAATGGFSTIYIPDWAKKTNVVLHELAHVIVQREYPGAAGHGWEFTAVFLRLSLLFMGREAHNAFKASMKNSRVRFRPKRARAPLSPERRAELVARLAAYRASKQQLAA